VASVSAAILSDAAHAPTTEVTWLFSEAISD